MDLEIIGGGNMNQTLQGLIHEITKPTRIELTVYSRDKESLKPLVDMLIEHGCIDFQWGHEFRETHGENYVSVELSGAWWLEQIAKLLPDYNGDGQEVGI